jgi:diguanylate cyclase (GGDEF)-like protein/PAS domain S-box-containing protein
MTNRKPQGTAPSRSPGLKGRAEAGTELTAVLTCNLRELFGSDSVIAALLAPDGSVLSSNRQDSVTTGISLAAHFNLEASEALQPTLMRVAQSGQSAQIEVSTLGGSGVRSWYLLSIHPVLRAQKLCGFSVYGADITERKREEVRLRHSEAMLVDTQGLAHLGVWEWDITQAQAVWSPELYRIYGLTPKNYVPTYENYLQRVHPDDRQRVIDATNEAFHNHKPYSHDERVFRSDGSLCYLHTWAFPVLDDVGKLVRLSGVCQDITDRKLAELERDSANELALSSQRLALHRAQFDELTRLPNREKFRNDLHELLANAGKLNRRFALVTVGLDHFSSINNALGYKIGDGILNEIALRLERQLPDSALLARTGADQFSWIADIDDGDAGTTALMKRCEELQKLLSAPLDLAQGATLSGSLGCALYPDHAQSAERLLQSSDTALHWVKDRGRRGLVKMYEPAMQQIASSALELSKELHYAVEHDQLKFHYQPIVSLADGKLLGVEALVRWMRSDGSYLPPDKFISVIEGSDLLRPFTDWTIATTCRQMADWRKRGIPVPYVSFNLSAAQMRFGQLDQDILHQMHETGVPGNALVVEITEGALLDSLDATHAMLSRLRQEGLSVAVDDFGVGYASPNYLRALPVDILKIDGSFLKDVPQDQEATSLINGIIEIGRSLQLKIVTECIETQEHADYLKGRGVASGQGFWFSKALPAGALESWMQQRATNVPVACS